MAPPVALDILKKYFELRQANPNYFQVCGNQSVTDCFFCCSCSSSGAKVLQFKLCQGRNQSIAKCSFAHVAEQATQGSQLSSGVAVLQAAQDSQK
jgi:hypothetical protein